MQEFKLNASGCDYQREDLAELIIIDWDALRYSPANPDEQLMEGEGTGPVDMTSQEIMMSNEVEEYSDELKRESDLELRDSLGKTTIAFVNIENMSGVTKGLLVTLIVAAFGGIAYYFYKELYLG